MSLFSFDPTKRLIFIMAELNNPVLSFPSFFFFFFSLLKPSCLENVYDFGIPHRFAIISLLLNGIETLLGLFLTTKEKRATEDEMAGWHR